jgi:hypothetical protein
MRPAVPGMCLSQYVGLISVATNINKNALILFLRLKMSTKTRSCIVTMGQ